MTTALALALIVGAASTCAYIAYWTGWQRGRDRADASHRVECAVCLQRGRDRHPSRLPAPRPAHETGQAAVDHWLDENYGSR